MDVQAFFSSVERHFQKAEYIAIRHLGFKMLSAPKRFENEACRVYAFLSNRQKAGAKLTEELADYAKSVAFYKSSQDNQKVYAICLFAAEDFSASQTEIFSKVKTHNGVTIIAVGYCEKDGKVIIPKKAGLLASVQTKKILEFAQTIVK